MSLPLVLGPVLCATDAARADEGGTSFWTPGQFATYLIASPPPTGWSLPIGHYYYSGKSPASASSTQVSAVPSGTRSQTSEFTVAPTYVLDASVLGGRLALIQPITYGSVATQMAGAPNQTVYGLADLTPFVTLDWKNGSGYAMVYATGNIPVGSYDAQRVSNIGIGHAAFDSGFALSYQSPATGRSASIATGLTYNFINPYTHYRNGIDWHASMSFTTPVADGWRLGLVGTLLYQLTDDTGSGNTCGACRSRVAGFGPQLNYVFAVDGQPWTFNVHGFYEFWAQNRLQGYVLFSSISIPISETPYSTPPRRQTR